MDDSPTDAARNPFGDPGERPEKDVDEGPLEASPQAAASPQADEPEEPTDGKDVKKKKKKFGGKLKGAGQFGKNLQKNLGDFTFKGGSKKDKEDKNSTLKEGREPYEAGPKEPASTTANVAEENAPSAPAVFSGTTAPEDAALRRENEELRHEVAELQELLARHKKAQSDMWASNEKALQEERQGHEETLHEEREARKQALQVERAANEDALREQRAANEAALQEQRAASEAALQEHRTANETALQEERAAHAAAREALEGAKAAQEAADAALREAQASSETALREARTQHEDALREEREHHEETLRTMRTANQEALQMEAKANEDVRQQEVAKHQQELEQHAADLEKERDVLQKTREVERLANEEALRQTEEEHTAALSAARQAHEKEVEEQAGALSAAREAHEKEVEEQAVALKTAREAHAKELDEQTAALEAARLEHEQALEDAANEHAEALADAHRGHAVAVQESWEKHERDLEAAREKHADELQETHQKHDAALSAAHAEHADELQKTRDEHVAALDSEKQRTEAAVAEERDVREKAVAEERRQRTEAVAAERAAREQAVSQEKKAHAATQEDTRRRRTRYRTQVRSISASLGRLSQNLERARKLPDAAAAGAALGGLERLKKSSLPSARPSVAETVSSPGDERQHAVLELVAKSTLSAATLETPVVENAEESSSKMPLTPLSGPNQEPRLRSEWEAEAQLREERARVEAREAAEAKIRELQGRVEQAESREHALQMREQVFEAQSLELAERLAAFEKESAQQASSADRRNASAHSEDGGVTDLREEEVMQVDEPPARDLREADHLAASPASTFDDSHPIFQKIQTHFEQELQRERAQLNAERAKLARDFETAVEREAKAMETDLNLLKARLAEEFRQQQGELENQKQSFEKDVIKLEAKARFLAQKESDLNDTSEAAAQSAQHHGPFPGNNSLNDEDHIVVLQQKEVALQQWEELLENRQRELEAQEVRLRTAWEEHQHAQKAAATSTVLLTTADDDGAKGSLSEKKNRFLGANLDHNAGTATAAPSSMNTTVHSRPEAQYQQLSEAIRRRSVSARKGNGRVHEGIAGLRSAIDLLEARSRSCSMTPGHSRLNLSNSRLGHSYGVSSRNATPFKHTTAMLPARRLHELEQSGKKGVEHAVGAGGGATSSTRPPVGGEEETSGHGGYEPDESSRHTMGGQPVENPVQTASRPVDTNDAGASSSATTPDEADGDVAVGGRSPKDRTRKPGQSRSPKSGGGKQRWFGKSGSPSRRRKFFPNKMFSNKSGPREHVREGSHAHAVPPSSSEKNFSSPDDDTLNFATTTRGGAQKAAEEPNREPVVDLRWLAQASSVGGLRFGAYDAREEPTSASAKRFEGGDEGPEEASAAPGGFGSRAEGSRGGQPGGLNGAPARSDPLRNSLELSPDNSPENQEEPATINANYPLAFTKPEECRGRQPQRGREATRRLGNENRFGGGDLWTRVYTPDRGSVRGRSEGPSGEHRQ